MSNSSLEPSNSLFQKLRSSKLRDVIWPIKSHELGKFLPMAILMFTILLNQNLVRGMKDSLIMTMVGAEVISFIKLWGEMPAGILFVVIYTKMCNVMTTERAFRYIVVTFLSLFSIMILFIFPNIDYFHPDPEIVSRFAQTYPYFKWFIIMWGNWSYVLFYIAGELWPVIVFSLLYWQLANKITKTEEASRFYSFFSLFGQSNLLFSGSLMVYFNSDNHFLMPLFKDAHNASEVLFKSLLIVVLASGAITLLLHKYIEVAVIKNPKYFAPVNPKKEVLHLSLRDSIKMILSSKYLAYICVLMVSYSVSINLIEGIWMAKVRKLYTTVPDYMEYQGIVAFWTGVFTLICAMLGSTIIRRFGWKAAAILPPAMIMFAGGLFFISIQLQYVLEAFMQKYMVISALSIIVFIGGLQNVLGKGTKYSLFDTTKEMAYIPLGEEMKTKGKAAVDVVGMKLGKSLGALIQVVIFTCSPNSTYDDMPTILMSLFFLVCTLWIISLKSLSKKYHNMLKNSTNA